MMKAYRCYGINGKKEIIAFTPKHGDADADEVELYLQPYCNEAEKQRKFIYRFIHKVACMCGIM